MTETKAILTLNLNTFIRYYSMDHSKLIGEIGRRMQTSGGYDFYSILSDAVRAKISGATEDEIQFILGRSSNPSEISYNKAAYGVFLEKYGSKKGLETFNKKGRVRLCNGQLTILVAPLFAVVTTNTNSAFNIWAAQKPALDRPKAGVGVHLMKQAFQKTANNTQFKVFDAVEGRTYSAVNNAIPQAVESVAKNIVEIARNS